MSFLAELLKKESTRYALTLVLGVAIGAIFYPTKSDEEKVTKKYQEEIASLKESYGKETQVAKEKEEKVVSYYLNIISDTEKKVTKLTSEVRSLKSKQKTSYYKIIKPDGTIEIKKFSESETDESSQIIAKIQEEQKQKLAVIESKYEEIHKQRVTEIKKEFDSKEQTYKKKIEELESSKITTVNQKKFGVEVGTNTEKQYYLHGTSMLFGPIFVGAHGESDKDLGKKSIGLGLGISF